MATTTEPTSASPAAKWQQPRPTTAGSRPGKRQRRGWLWVVVVIALLVNYAATGVRERAFGRRVPVILSEKSPGAFRTRGGSFRGHELVRPLCCKIPDPLEFQGRRFAFSDDGRPPALIEG